MYPISSAVKALFDSEQHQVLRITGTDKNSTAINITDANVVMGGFNIDRYCCNGEKLEVGTAIAGQMTLKLNNTDGSFNGVVFEGTELFVEVGIADWSQSNPTITYIPCGYFTPDMQPRRLNRIDLTCLDRMTKFDAAVDTTALTFPTTVAGLVGQVNTLCGVSLAESISALPNASVSITELPTTAGGITYRNLIQWCAGMMATNAWIDWNGLLRFTWYDNATNYETTKANRFSSDLYEDDLTITGAVYTTSGGVEIVEGTNDYAIDLTGNELAGPLISTVLPEVNTAVNGFVYRPFAATVINAPYLWPMDVVTFVDGEGARHTSALTNVAFGINVHTAIESRGMTYAINQRAQPKGVTKEQAQLISEAMEQVETDIDESLTQEEIFNRLTDNGAAQGLVLLNGQLYVNASYIRSGTLVLGGLNDQHGTLQVLDASGSEIGTWSRRGIVVGQNGAVRCAVYHDFGPELRYDFVSQRNGMVAMLDQGKVTVFDGSLASAVITATNKASLSPKQLSIDADDPGEAASALLKGWATIVDAATGLDKVVHSQSELTSGGLTLENEDDGQWFGLDRDALRYSGEVQLETPLGMEYGGTGGYFNVGAIRGADTSAGKSLMEMGLISRSGFYVLVLALVTSSTQDASSAYVLRYTGSTLYIIGKLHEGTANGAPILSASGVISRKDGGTIATSYNLRYVSIYIPN